MSPNSQRAQLISCYLHTRIVQSLANGAHVPAKIISNQGSRRIAAYKYSDFAITELKNRHLIPTFL